MIKGFLGTLVGATLGGAAISQVGKLDFSLKVPTQSFIGLGIAGIAAKSLKESKWFK